MVGSVLLGLIWRPQPSSALTSSYWRTHQASDALSILHPLPQQPLRGGSEDSQILKRDLEPEAIPEVDSVLRRESLLSRSADRLRGWTSSESRRGNSEAKGNSEEAPLFEAGRNTAERSSHDVSEDDRHGRSGVSAGPRLKCTVVEPREKHTATIIWLHGHDHDPEDLIEGNLPDVLALPWCKFVFVHSPKGSGGGSGGAGESPEGAEGAGDEWKESDRGGRWLPAGQSAIAEMDGLLRLVNGVHRIIRQETSGETGVPSQRVALVGHGEGGVVAMAAALSFRQSLGALVCLSCWFPRILLGWCDGQTVRGACCLLQPETKP